MAGPDLHIHSTASDGTLTPRDIVQRAASLGLPAIAITDHDTVAGVAAARDAALAYGLRVIPAVELSAGVGDRGVHVLGFFIDPTDPIFERRLAALRSVRLERAERIVASLRDAGHGVSLHDVLDAAGGGAVGRAHVAHVLVSAGIASSVGDAFNRMLGKGRPHYVAKPLADVAEVVGWMAEAGGIAVVAHPSLSRIDDLLPQLIAAGIAGIEAHHGSHDVATRTRYARLASENGLIVTGGSDFHGDDAEGGPLGSAAVPPEVLDALVERHARAEALRSRS